MQVMVSRNPSEALQQIWMEDAAIEGDDDREPPPVFRQTESQPEPEPLRIPPPDWRAEERERAKRENKSAPVELESPQSLQSRPAVKRKRTPLLDEVKRWREQNR
jgi:hypothetical protein